MIVKKFQGETEKDAILKAQEELGNNAVVLNVKTIKQRGILKLFKKDVVEVTAALEEEELSKKANTGAKEFGKAFEASSYAGNMHKQPDISSRPAGGLNLLADEKISVSSESAVIEQKLDSLHSLLQSQINAGASRKNSMQVDDEKERDDIAAERIAGKKAVEERENANMKFIRLIYKKLVDNEVNEKFAEKYPSQFNSWKATEKGDKIIYADEQDPRLIVLWGGYSFAKEYNAPRGHVYAVKDVRDILRTGAPKTATDGPQPMACWTCKGPDVPRLIAEWGEDGYFGAKWAKGAQKL